MARRTDTRQRMLDSAADLFHTQGYHATGLNQLVSAGGAPKGSLYFHFPGGKEQLAAEALELSGARLGALLRQLLEAADDPAEAITSVVDMLANILAESDFQRGCPLATVALDAATESEPIRSACAGSYAGWHRMITDYLVRQGIEAERAEALGLVAISSIEGALMLAKLNQDLAPMYAVGAHLRETYAKEI
ncbi:TetR/AcrR family transcriptional regulator [Amycolatopsis sp.]|uniref:TetR/AcrR family transcriptional regulator n=1 Tax=Amycolatopsis sp. TaxID=37632 RepID=UPI002BACBA1D|nr:TetR family transcriptional regulator [Amycolatopsis sp.]HVV11682.1 TetR family transcriptional regulator [Amycolatopsis sp.]